MLRWCSALFVPPSRPPSTVHVAAQVPWDGAHAVEFSVLFFVQGLCMSWCFAATNRPIFSELAPPATRATLLAWAVAIEGSGAAILGAPLVP